MKIITIMTRTQAIEVISKKGNKRPRNRRFKKRIRNLKKRNEKIRNLYTNMLKYDIL